MESLETAYTVLYDNISKIIPVGSRLAIYGIGDAAYHVNEILKNEYQIIGFLDRDPANTGQPLFGGVVVPLEAAADANAIVIASNPIYWDPIHRRIHAFAERYGIMVFSTNGVLAQLIGSEVNQVIPYWNVSMDELERFCFPYDIISFDIFDTLITRRIAEPKDVFSVMAEQISDKQKHDGFVVARKRARELCRRQFGGIYTISAVYDTIDYAFFDPQKLLDMELDTEATLLTVRIEMCDLFHRLLATGKRVILVSDMYVPSAWLTMQLAAHDINGYERIFLSCEEGATKETGELWKRVRQYTDTLNICHIGDNRFSDIEQAKSAGIPAFYCMSELDMLRSSTLFELVNHVQSVGDSITLGMIKHKIMHHPYGMFGSNGKPTITELETFGYVFFGPLVYTFFSWLMNKLTTTLSSVHTVLFSARDGWLFQKIYNSVRKTNESLPPCHYLPTSRRMCSVAAFFTEEDVFNSLFPVFTGRMDVFFRIRLGLEYTGPEPEKMIRSDEPDITLLVKTKMDAILDNAYIERQRYLQYIYGLLPAGTDDTVLFDFGRNATMQHHLEKICNCTFNGLYIYLNSESKYIHHRCTGLYQKAFDDGYAIMEKLLPISEAIFTAPEGTCLYINDKGEYITDETVSNGNNFDEIERIHNGIIEFIHEYNTLINNGRFGTPPRKEYAAIVANSIDQVSLHERIKKACVVGDNYMGQPMTPVFY